MYIQGNYANFFVHFVYSHSYLLVQMTTVVELQLSPVIE
uniref:Uncharacterized protein n=1 Tax=Anguilla anguilla TaxID=7936 RepID=A0A0E9SUA5_ANGAN